MAGNKIALVFIKPKVVLFGESLPLGVLDGAMNACRECDYFLIVGIAKQNGTSVIFINREGTVMDNLAEVFLRGTAVEIFIELMKLINPH